MKNAIQAWGSKDPETAQADQLIRDLEQFGTPQPMNASLGIKGEVQVLGYAEGVVEEGGSLRFSQCGLVFRFGGSVTYTQSFFVPFLPIPLYYEVGGSAELGLTSPIVHYDPQANALVPLEQTLEGQVSIFGGGGASAGPGEPGGAPDPARGSAGGHTPLRLRLRGGGGRPAGQRLGHGGGGGAEPEAAGRRRAWR